MKTVDEAFELELSKLVECIYTSWTNDLKTLPIRFRYTTQKYRPFKAFCQVYQKNLQIGKASVYDYYTPSGLKHKLTSLSIVLPTLQMDALIFKLKSMAKSY